MKQSILSRWICAWRLWVTIEKGDKKMRMKKMNSVALVVGLILGAVGVLANNLAVTNVTLVSRDSTTTYIEFDIAWSNSWRYTNINHDAAWVFFKMQEESTTTWTHVMLESAGINPAGTSPPARGRG
ncbi:MAG: hypothetical protein IPN90_04900 [Elusimicrobia bacterium]|nr:hypothetical protein [Elusimicrobiota bacterium]